MLEPRDKGPFWDFVLGDEPELDKQGIAEGRDRWVESGGVSVFAKKLEQRQRLAAELEVDEVGRADQCGRVAIAGDVREQRFVGRRGPACREADGDQEREKNLPSFDAHRLPQSGRAAVRWVQRSMRKCGTSETSFAAVSARSVECSCVGYYNESLWRRYSDFADGRRLGKRQINARLVGVICEICGQRIRTHGERGHGSMATPGYADSRLARFLVRTGVRTRRPVAGV
ncbi:MAG: hypothetical protein AB7O68_11185 [Pirellulales bacterium]